MNIAQMDLTLADQGWVAIDMPDPSAIFDARDRLLAHLSKTLPTIECLDDYHLHFADDDRHIEILHDLASFYWESGLGGSIIAHNLDLFRQLVGPDLHIPLHRDTYYGASPFEVSVVVPFTEMEADSALRVISGSHLAPDSAYPYSQTDSLETQIGSPKHELGYPYSPRLLDSGLVDAAEPVPLKVGQAVIFPLQMVHGGGTNQSRRTRFSTDIRLANSLAPVNWSRGVRKDYFVPLCTSAVTKSAQAFLAANADTNGRGSK
jgi:hypothetical protein